MKLALTRWIAPAIAMVMLSGPAFGAAGQPVSKPAPGLPTAPAPSPAPETQLDPTFAPMLALLTSFSSVNPQGLADATSYQAREQQARGLEGWKGGAGVSIYLGGSALAIALLIVLILVLL